MTQQLTIGQHVLIPLEISRWDETPKFTTKPKHVLYCVERLTKTQAVLFCVQTGSKGRAWARLSDLRVVKSECCNHVFATYGCTAKIADDETVSAHKKAVAEYVEARSLVEKVKFKMRDFDLMDATKDQLLRIYDALGESIPVADVQLAQAGEKK